MAEYLLIVDDDQLLRRSLAFSLQQAGYMVQSVASAEEALSLVNAEAPDLVLLDIGLPGIDGLETLRLLRDRVPVIFVSARQRLFDEVLGLELGAEDYITKPFEFEVLLARVRTVLRRTRRQGQSTVNQNGAIHVGDLTIVPASYEINCAGRTMHLPPKEFRLLHTLAQSAGQVVPAEQLLDKVWGAAFAGEPQILYVHIRSLREKLETDPQHPQRIVTVRSVGYKLVSQGE